MLQSELVANEELPRRRAATRGCRPCCASPLEPVEHDARRTCACNCVHRTRRSGIGVAAAADHVVEAPDGVARPTASESARTGGGSTVTAACAPGRPCGWSSSSATAGRRLRSTPGAARPGGGRADRRDAHRLGRAARATSASSSTTSGRAPTSRSTATPRCSRRCGSRSSTCCSPACGPRSGRSPAKGLTGPGLRRPLLLGHRDLRAAGARAHLAGGGRATPCAGGTAPCDGRASGRGQLGLAGAALPVAHDQRRGVLRLLAGRDRGLPHQRRHRGRRDPLPRRHPGRRRSTPRSASSCSSRPPGSGASLGHHDRDGGCHDRRRHRARRVQRRGRRQRLHEPDGAAEPARRRRRRGPAPTRARRRAGRHRRRRSSLGARRGRRRPAVRRGARRAPAVGGVHPPRRCGTSSAPRPSDYPLLLHYPYFDLYRKQVDQAGRPGARHAVARRRLHARAEGRATSPTTRRSRSATPRSRPAPRR